MKPRVDRTRDVYAVVKARPYARIDAIVAAVGTSKTTVCEILRRLREDGIIDWRGHGRSERVYRILRECPEEFLDTCPLCQIRYDEHPRCAGCTVCVGPKHAERVEDLIDGYCACCWGFVVTRNLTHEEIRARVQRKRMRRAA